jgi:transcriptional regulator with XRE-family HTH domain
MLPISLAICCNPHSQPVFSMKKTRRRTACEGTGTAVVLEQREGSGPWDGVVDPEGGNSAVRQFMKWYRQRLGLSLHQVGALTGIDRAYLRRLERRRINLSLAVLWRWANGLHVNVDWVLKMARRKAQERAALKAANRGGAGGSPAAPCWNPTEGAECAHASHDRQAEPAATALPAAETAALGRPGDGASENSFPAGREGTLGLENSFPEDLLFADLPEKSFPAPGHSGLGLENFFPRGGDFPWGAKNSFPAPVLMALVS